jgi:hypothetical protein
MTWYADLGRIDYFREYSFPGLRAVGWLGDGHPFPQGEVSQEFVERLSLLLVYPWDPVEFRGFHTCEFCPDPELLPVSSADDPGEHTGNQRPMRRLAFNRVSLPEIVVGAEVAKLGVANLFVPGKRCVYVAPSLIAHYILVHRYSPPKKFVDAVLRCPETHSVEYLQARRTLPQTEFIRWKLQCREPRSPEYLKALGGSGATKLVEWSPYWFSFPTGL